jgi:transposase-like protein
MAINLTDPVFTDETKAREYLEAIRWPDGPYCPHCGETERVYRLHGKSHRPGLIHCNSCEGSFTVTTGSVMESSHLPLTKWVLAYRLMAASKKGMSAHQLHRSIGVTYKTAWFLWHRIREAMRETSAEPLGGTGKTVEADETYVGGKPRKSAAQRSDLGRHQRVNQGAMGRATKKTPVVALVERGGRAAAKPVIDASAQTLTPLLRRYVDRGTTLMTDEWRSYLTVGKDFASHERVNHGWRVRARRCSRE